MAQNNSVFVFVQKTSNYSCGGPNLTIDMNQVTNPKNTGFYMKKEKNTGFYMKKREKYWVFHEKKRKILGFT